MDAEIISFEEAQRHYREVNEARLLALHSRMVQREADQLREVYRGLRAEAALKQTGVSSSNSGA